MGSIPLLSRLTLNFPRERHAGCSKTGIPVDPAHLGHVLEGDICVGLPVWQKYRQLGGGWGVGQWWGRHRSEKLGPEIEILP